MNIKFMRSQKLSWLCLRKPREAGYWPWKSPAKARDLGSSCWEVRWHSWIGFALKALFCLAHWYFHGCTVWAPGHPTVGQLSSFHCSCIHCCVPKDALVNGSSIIREICISYCQIEIPLTFQVHVFIVTVCLHVFTHARACQVFNTISTCYCF